MSAATRSIQVFGVYALVAGGTLGVFPDLLLSLGGLPPAKDFWVRAVGLLGAVVGYYYLAAAASGNTSFYRASVRGRIGFCAGCGLLVATGAPPLLMAFGLVDVAGAVWTARALRRPG